MLLLSAVDRYLCRMWVYADVYSRGVIAAGARRPYVRTFYCYYVWNTTVSNLFRWNGNETALYKWNM